MKKKLLSALFALSLFLTLLPFPVLAEEDTAPTDITEIGTAEELKQFILGLHADKQYEGASFLLTADIDLSENGQPWIVVVPDNIYAPFSGLFDGGGHIISGFQIDGVTNSASAALFPGIGEMGIVQNLGVKGESLGATGGAGIALWNDGIIRNCYNASNVTGYARGGYGFGGIAAKNQGLIENCYNTGNITGAIGVGGIVDDNTPSWVGPGDNISAYPGTIRNCYNTGHLMDSNTLNIGSIARHNDDSTGIINCYTLAGSIVYTDHCEEAQEKSENEFALQDTFEGWDFTSVWKMSPSLGRPILQAVPEPEWSHTHNDVILWHSGIWGVAIESDHNAARHWTECTECGRRINIEKHDYIGTHEEGFSCTTGGILKNCVCSICGHTDERVLLPPTEHNCIDEWANDSDQHWHPCTNCNDSVDVAPHEWDAGVETVPPTATTTGTKTYTCNVCGRTKAEVIPATGSGSSSSGSSSSGGSFGNWTPSYSITVSKNTPGGQVNVSSKTASRTDTVTVTVQTESGYLLNSLVALDRRETEITLTILDDQTYSFVMPGSDVTIEAEFITIPTENTSSPATIALPFIDVASNAWYYNAVANVYAKGIMNGITGDLFAPQSPASRGMVVTILYRMENEPAVSGTPFSDIAEKKYYAKAVAWAAENQIVVGFGDGTFRPEQTITREQLSAILYRYSQYKGLNITSRSILSGYQDADKISRYARESMGWANAEGLITGVSGNRLAPRAEASRAEVAMAIARFLEYEAKSQNSPQG